MMASDLAKQLALWIKAFEWNLANPDAGTAWAYNQIAQSAEPPGWVIDLATSPTTKDALSRLREWKARLGAKGVNELSLTLGYLFAQYLSNKLSLNELLKRAGEAADIADSQDPPCEAFLRLLTDLEKGRSKTETERLARPLFEVDYENLRALLSSISINLDESIRAVRE